MVDTEYEYRRNISIALRFGGLGSWELDEPALNDTVTSQQLRSHEATALTTEKGESRVLKWEWAGDSGVVFHLTREVQPTTV